MRAVLFEIVSTVTLGLVTAFIIVAEPSFTLSVATLGFLSVDLIFGLYQLNEAAKKASV